MGSVKSFIKRIPIFGGALIKLKTLFRRKPPAIQGHNNKINNQGVLDKVVFDIIGNNNNIQIGKGTIIRNTLIYIRGNNHQLIIKDNCYCGGGELWIEDKNCTLLIHEHTTVEQAHLAVTEPNSVLEIHKDCMLAKQVEIRTGDSHSILDKQTGKRINKAANVCLQQHVWVGTHAIILKGVTIGNNSVIGTASVVTSDIPSFSIAAGIPAKVIRSGIDWNRERHGMNESQS